MLIPLGTDVRLRRPTLVTYVLMAVCAVTFVGQKVSDAQSPPSARDVFDQSVYEPLVLYAFPTREAWAERVESGEEITRFNPPRWWQFFTYQFLHGGWMHLLGNMVFLLVFGPPVEDRLRRVGFLALFLLTGAFAGLAHGALEPPDVWLLGGQELSVTPRVIGASGAIAGVTGAYLVLFPKAMVKLLFFFVLIGRFALPGWVFVGISIFFDLFFLSAGDRGVAHLAHLGGYAAGIAVAMLLLWRRVIPSETYDLFSIARQAHRRRQYRELVTKGGGRSPFVKDTPSDRSSRVSARADADPHAEERREIGALAKRDAEGATDRYLTLLREDPRPTLGRDAQLVVANTLLQRGDHQNAVDAYERFLERYPSDREADQTRLMIAMVCTRQLNDPVCATKMLDELDEDRLPEGLRPLVATLREELG